MISARTWIVLLVAILCGVGLYVVWPAPQTVPPQPQTAGPAMDSAPLRSGLRHTGRALLFSGETEESGYALYSYLLYAGSARAGVEHDRFVRAVEAFVYRVSTAAALTSGGAARIEINMFYAPVKPVLQNDPETIQLLRNYPQVAQRLQDNPQPDMRIYFDEDFFNDDLVEDEQVVLLHRNYDYARAKVLIGNAGLIGSGPFIVSVLRPLSEQNIASGEAFLIQDLSNVPPDMVELWVAEFMRQVPQEAVGNPERLRRFALNLFTTIAVLAESFAITKSAVAAMFKAPEGVGSGDN